MFTKAIVRTPSKSMVDGLTTAKLGKPDYKKALIQHKNYIKALEKCGLDVTVLEPLEAFPDSVFIEDVALCTSKCAIITNPGAPSRKGEIVDLDKALRHYYFHIEKIDTPGTIEAGDVMMVGNHYYIGLSERTNVEGANQMVNILKKHEMRASLVTLEHMLHLKTGLAYLENNNLIATGEFLTMNEFENFNIIEIPKEEEYAANCIWVNGKVIIPGGFPKAKKVIEDAGYLTIEVDVSEFQKLDGGLSCLSLRF